MEKLKLQLEPVARHWFWISTGLVLLGSFIVWWMASGRLVAEYETARSRIESDAQRINSVSSKVNEHPNPKTHDEMERLIDSSEQAVLDAWTTVYESQQGILVWPVEELKEDFVREFKDLTPIELKVPFPTLEEDEKETSLRNRYRYYIGTVLPGIAAIAKTKWTANFDSTTPGGMGGSMGFDGGYSEYAQPGMPTADDGPLVRWDTGSQEALLNDLFPWRANGGTPKTLDVLYSQENLWILRQLMQIIADVNGDAGQRFQAKIHAINNIAIGSSVKYNVGQITKPAASSAMGMDESMMGMDMGMDAGMGMDPGMGMDGMGLEVDPGDNRYVDTAGKPLLASQLRAALSSNSPTDAFMAVAKRIPVMMSFRMDQRAVPDLLAKCGSAKLMVEVRQVRILPTGASQMNDMGGGGYSPMMDPSAMGIDMSGMGMDSPVNEQFPLDLDVEVYGIIYIYNPPLAEKLGVEQVDENTVIDGTSMRDGSKVDVPVEDATPLPAAPAVDVTPPVEQAPVEQAPVEQAPVEQAPVDAPVPADPAAEAAAADPAAVQPAGDSPDAAGAPAAPDNSGVPDPAAVAPTAPPDASAAPAPGAGAWVVEPKTIQIAAIVDFQYAGASIWA